MVVTGASGFVGRAVLVALAGRGIPVIAASRSSVPPVPGVAPVQVADYRDLDPPAGAVLLHLAEPRDMAAAEAAGARHATSVTDLLAGLLARSWSHVVYASSAAVYGDGSDRPRQPDEAVEPPTVYGRAKLACEAMVLTRGGSVARLANVYGPGMAGNNVISDILAQMCASGPISVRATTPVRDFLWVDDAGEALAVLALRRPGGVFNIGSGRSVSVAELAESALRVAGQQHRAVVATRPEGPPSRLRLDLSKTAQTLGWSADMTLDRGLALLLKLPDDAKSNSDLYREQG